MAFRWWPRTRQLTRTLPWRKALDVCLGCIQSLAVEGQDRVKYQSHDILSSIIILELRCYTKTIVLYLLVSWQSFYLFHDRQVVAQKKLTQSHDRLSCNCNIVISCFSRQYRVVILSHGRQVVIQIKWPCFLTDCPETWACLVWYNSTNQWPRLVTDNVLLLAVLSHDSRATYECYDLFVMMSMRAEACCCARVNSRDCCQVGWDNTQSHTRLVKVTIGNCVQYTWTR